MKSMQTICYNLHVSVIEKKDVGIATRIPDSMKRELDRIADEHDRTTAYVIRELIIRGLAAYKIDGKLRGSLPEYERSKNVSSHLAPVVARIEPGSGMTKEQIRRTINAEEISEIERRVKPRKTVQVPILKKGVK